MWIPFTGVLIAFVALGSFAVVLLILIWLDRQATGFKKCPAAGDLLPRSSYLLMMILGAISDASRPGSLRLLSAVLYLHPNCETAR